MKRILITTSVITLAIFSCKKKDHAAPPTAPLVQTAALTNVVASSGTATAGGSIVSDNGAAVTKSGIVWSKTDTLPTLTDSMVAASVTTGAFTVNITGIDFGNKYYFRAFATNSAGTGYGSVVILTTSNDSVKFTYNGQSVTYGTIISPTTGKKWLDRNLGSKKPADSLADYNAFGDLFQWGRSADGHQLVNWTSSTIGTPINGVTTTLATSDNPGHNNFIDASSNSSLGYDWRSDNNSNRWNTAPQGPCPAGWHVPTQIEWAAEVSKTQTGGTAVAGGITDYNTAYSQLKLPAAGRREGFLSSPSGQLARTGTRSYYWSSTALTASYTSAATANFGPTFAQVVANQNAYGFSVRCIKD